MDSNIRNVLNNLNESKNKTLYKKLEKIIQETAKELVQDEEEREYLDFDNTIEYRGMDNDMLEQTRFMARYIRLSIREWIANEGVIAGESLREQLRYHLSYNQSLRKSSGKTKKLRDTIDTWVSSVEGLDSVSKSYEELERETLEYTIEWVRGYDIEFTMSGKGVY